MVIKHWIILPPKVCELYVFGGKIQNMALSNVLQAGVWDKAISRGTVQPQLFRESDLGMEKVLQNSSDSGGVISCCQIQGLWCLSDVFIMSTYIKSIFTFW